MDNSQRWERNRALAVALGYTAKFFEELNGYLYPVKGYRIYDPRGVELIDFDGLYSGDLTGYATLEDAFSVVPDFYGSLDASVNELPEGFDFRLVAIYDGSSTPVKQKGYRGLITTWSLLDSVEIALDDSEVAGNGDTRAEALAAALLAWALAAKAGTEAAG